MIVDPMLIAMPLSIIVLIVVSYLTPKMEEEHMEKCMKGIK